MRFENIFEATHVRLGRVRRFVKRTTVSVARGAAASGSSIRGFPIFSLVERSPPFEL